MANFKCFLPLYNLHKLYCKYGLCFLVCLGPSPPIVGKISETVVVFIVVAVLALAVIAIVIPVVIVKRSCFATT